MFVTMDTKFFVTKSLNTFKISKKFKWIILYLFPLCNGVGPFVSNFYIKYNNNNNNNNIYIYITLDCANVDYKNLFQNFQTNLGSDVCLLFWGVGTHKLQPLNKKKNKRWCLANLLCCQKCFKFMNFKSKNILCTKEDFQCDINILWKFLKLLQVMQGVRVINCNPLSILIYNWFQL